MSARLEAAIKSEIVVDESHEMPDFKGVAWTPNSKGGETVLD